MGQRKRAQLRIGCSGYQYDHWRGLFYPEDLPKRRWFEHYARHFDTVEVNNTFYRLPGENVFDAWLAQAPPGFLYALKFSQYGSHRKRLKEPENSVARFTAVAQRLRRTLGPILVQLPPRWGADPARLDAFLAFAPRRFRWAVELRDPAWLTAEVFAVLRRHHAALCIHDMLPDHPRELTTDWTYLRFHGGGTHDGNYDTPRLKREAAAITDDLAAGRDVYAYFNNDQHGHAIRNALQLRDLLQATATRVAPPRPRPPAPLHAGH